MTPEERRDAHDYNRSCLGCIRWVLLSMSIVLIGGIISFCTRRG